MASLTRWISTRRLLLAFCALPVRAHACEARGHVVHRHPTDRGCRGGACIGTRQTAIEGGQQPSEPDMLRRGIARTLVNKTVVPHASVGRNYTFQSHHVVGGTREGSRLSACGWLLSKTSLCTAPQASKLMDAWIQEGTQVRRFLDALWECVKCRPVCSYFF